MVAIFFRAYWSKPDERMIVELELPKSRDWTQISKANLRDHKKPTDRYVERFDLDGWRQFVDALDEVPLRLGGVNVTLNGNDVGDTEQQLKDYLRKVDKAFRLTGQTEYLSAT